MRSGARWRQPKENFLFCLLLPQFNSLQFVPHFVYLLVVRMGCKKWPLCLPFFTFCSPFCLPLGGAGGSSGLRGMTSLITSCLTLVYLLFPILFTSWWRWWFEWEARNDWSDNVAVEWRSNGINGLDSKQVRTAFLEAPDGDLQVHVVGHTAIFPILGTS